MIVADCEAVERLFTGAGVPTPGRLWGKTTIDVNQYRVRGRFVLETSENGMTLQFSSSGIAGGGHEDVVFSSYNDTLRVLDRERGKYYEGEEVRRLVVDGLEAEVDVDDILARLMTEPPSCAELSGVKFETWEPKNADPGGAKIRGRYRGHPFDATFAGGRMIRSTWTGFLPADPGVTLEVSFDWEWRGGEVKRLRELVVYVPERRWRLKLQPESVTD